MELKTSVLLKILWGFNKIKECYSSKNFKFIDFFNCEKLKKEIKERVEIMILSGCNN